MKTLLAICVAFVLGWQTASATTNTFPLKSTPGIYESLRWVNVTAITVGDGFSGSVKPASGNTYGLATKPKYDGGVGAQPVVITSQYSGSKVDSFSLKSFYFGCAVETQYYNGSPSPFYFPAENCTVNVAGYKATGKTGDVPLAGATPDASASFQYIPEPQNDMSSTPANMTKYTLPKTFTGLKLVQLTYQGTAVSYQDNSTGGFYFFMDGAAFAYLDNVVFSTVSS